MKSINWAYEKIQKEFNEDQNDQKDKNLDAEDMKNDHFPKNDRHNKSRKRQPVKSTKNKNVNKMKLVFILTRAFIVIGGPMPVEPIDLVRVRAVLVG